MIDKNDILSEELYNQFDSFTLLTAIDHLDKMRSHLAGGINFDPPQIRQDLMNLHEMVMDATNGSTEHNVDDISLQLDEVECLILNIQEEAEKMLLIFSDLNNALNNAWNRSEQEE